MPRVTNSSKDLSAFNVFDRPTVPAVSAKAKKPTTAALMKELRAQIESLNLKETPIDVQSVRRVSSVLELADALLLSRERVEQLITEVVFETVATVLSTLAGQQASKSLKNALGFPVTHLTIGEVKAMCKSLKTTKELSQQPDPLKKFFGSLIK